MNKSFERAHKRLLSLPKAERKSFTIAYGEKAEITHCGWIEPDGTMHNVPFGGHEPYLNVVLGKDVADIEKTWVRVSKEYSKMEHMVQFEGKKLTHAQDKALAKLGLYWVKSFKED